ncbi:MAG: fibronectin type III domain-containing protein [Thermoplasmata archaeon]|nr:fibronectin type III domain-containing protein [Thermoplasmata archaeon]
MRRWSLFVVLVVMASVFALSIPFVSDVSATTLYVGGAGPGNYTTIQAAIDAANPGETVFVFSGTYYENVVVNKTMSLMGESRDATIIDGGGVGDTVYLTASWVNITGFTVTGSDVGGIEAGIRLQDAHNCNVSWNNVSGNGFGITLNQAHNSTIAHNNLFLNSDNIAMYVTRSTNATITQNVMSRNGIYVDGSLLEHWNSHTIDTTNTVDGDPVYYWKDVVGGTAPSDAAQVILANCSHWLVEGMYVDNSSVAVQLGFSSNNTIASNTAVRNRMGMLISDSRDNIVTGNNISDNYFGIIIMGSENNTLFHNLFINNTMQAAGSGPNTWDNGYPSGGNYWSDYAGTDDKLGPDQDIPGSDGIGDTPYEYHSGDGIDMYPLMGPDPPSFALPTPPRNLQAVAGDDHVNLTWEPPVSDGGLPVMNYSVYRGTSPGQGTLHVEVGNVTSFSDASVLVGVTYYYSVAAVTFVGEGPLSNEASATPADVPGAPSDLTAVAGNGQADLIWHEPGDDGGSPITNYTIFRGPAPGQETYLTTIGNVLSHTDTGLENDMTYYYRVAAVNGIGTGARSNEANATPFNQIPDCVISAPTSGTVVSGDITVAGTSHDPDGAVVTVEVKMDDGPWTPVSGTVSWSYEWDTTSVADGNHTIHARSFDGTTYSAEVAVTIHINNTVPPPEDDDEDFMETWTWITRIFMIVVLSVFLVVAINAERKRRKRRQMDSEARALLPESKEDGAEPWKGPAERLQGYFFVVFVNAIIASSLFLIALTVTGVTLVGGVLFLVVSFSLFACYIMVQMKEWR